MSRYKKIDSRMWGDAHFLALSERARFLWVYLLTGPHTTGLPGAYIGGEAMLSEALGWSLEVFRKAFGEVFQEGLILADWKTRFLWIPNAIKYDRPESPNVVRHWGKLFDDLPECALKTEAYQRIKAFLEALGKGFAEAFEEAFSKPLAKPSPNPEPEPLPFPEPSKDLRSPESATAFPEKRLSKSKSLTHRLVGQFADAYLQWTGQTYAMVPGRDGKLMKEIAAALANGGGMVEEEIERHVAEAISRFFDESHRFKGNMDVPQFKRAFNRLQVVERNLDSARF